MIDWFARFRNRTAAFVHDLCMVPVAWFGAFWLRFNLEIIPEAFLWRALALFPVIWLIHAAMFLYFGLYRGVWRFASMPDFVRILKAVAAAALVSVGFVFALTQMHLVPRSVFVLHGLLLLLLLGTPRFLYRWAKDHRFYVHPPNPRNRVLIVGAGSAGEALARELAQNSGGEYEPVAFVDDDPGKIGKELRGLRVAAQTPKIPRIVSRYAVDQIFIAIPSVSSEAMQRIVAHCEASGKPFRTLPPLQDLLSGRVTIQELRKVSIEDLLGREPVSLDWETIRRELSGRRVLVSGGGGSIGSELCRQVARLEPAALIIVEHSEFNLYRIDRELRERWPAMELYTYLGDVHDAGFLDHLLQRARPEVVFHAAAYKHVPMLQNQLREALRNNLFGTISLAEAAKRQGCRTFVLISTDKAVNPVSVMGASKRLAEMYCQHVSTQTATRFVIVRFGNVLDSAGSVVPLFRQQIAAGGPVTVTDPNVTRYFMTLQEASQLILQAGAVGQGGEIFVLDMGTPINIKYLAEQMILLSGKTPGVDIRIDIIGLRPGEKLHEELFYKQESIMPTAYPKLQLAQQYGIDSQRFAASLQALRSACNVYDEERAAALVSEMVPEFRAASPMCGR
ncbi:MAG: polysaccharide biosynthesis protein [Gammaproteobacteria bacterium]|nr:polysaccharide biosynthesis protein [Gammaproteobacteria bacterium]